MERDRGTKRKSTIVVEWWDWGDPDRDWAYHLRVGDLDAEEVTVLSAEATPRCACCGHHIVPRDPDPWEGRMNAYCEFCCHSRCDVYPDPEIGEEVTVLSTAVMPMCRCGSPDPACGCEAGPIYDFNAEGET